MFRGDGQIADVSVDVPLASASEDALSLHLDRLSLANAPTDGAADTETSLRAMRVRVETLRMLTRLSAAEVGADAANAPSLIQPEPHPT